MAADRKLLQLVLAEIAVSDHSPFRPAGGSIAEYAEAGGYGIAQSWFKINDSVTRVIPLFQVSASNDGG